MASMTLPPDYKGINGRKHLIVYGENLATRWDSPHLQINVNDLDDYLSKVEAAPAGEADMHHRGCLRISLNARRYLRWGDAHGIPKSSPLIYSQLFHFIRSAKNHWGQSGQGDQAPR
jgi:hypothetical protein